MTVTTRTVRTTVIPGTTVVTGMDADLRRASVAMGAAANTFAP